MDFDINAFVEKLRKLMYNAFPYESDDLKKIKHPKTPKHIRDVAFYNNQVLPYESGYMFEIGNAESEKSYPYYHILEDAPVIRKKGKGTKKTKGSQAKIYPLEDRDYGRVYFNGKTYGKEYARNVRGARDRTNKVTHYVSDSNRNKYLVNRESNSYENTHYQYIEKMLNNFILDQLASEFGLKRKRTESTGLEEEYNLQEEYTTFDNDIVNMLSSFM